MKKKVLLKEDKIRLGQAYNLAHAEYLANKLPQQQIKGRAIKIMSELLKAEQLACDVWGVEV